MGPSTFCVLNLGCKVNRVESDAFAAKLLALGARAVSLEDAEWVIVNTCTVTGEADKKTRKAVRHALKANDSAKVVVTGCAAALEPEVYQAMGDRVEVVSKGLMSALLSSPDDDNARWTQRDEDLFDFNSADSILRVGEGFPTRVGVKVQDGCNNACTFCIVHTARGRAVSRPLSQVVDEVSRLVDAGVREIVLTGINLGSYNSEGCNLAGLCRKLLGIMPDDSRLRIGSVEPRDVDENLIELLASSNGRLCRHMHLPLQAGSTKVLHEMARPYSADAFLALVNRLYEAVPTMSLSTDVIVGFPGETEEEFQETLALCEACRFSKIHVFRYSIRENTPAARRIDQVDPEVKADRAKRLEELEERLRQEDYDRRRGTAEFVLVETLGNATTESYHTVPAPEGYAEGSLVEIVL